MRNTYKHILSMKGVQIVTAILIIIICSYVFKNKEMQGINWTFPYCSGAANFRTLFDWRISPTEYNKIVKMKENEQRAYRYQATDKTILNTVNQYGYVLVSLVARHLFPKLGDIQGLILLQLITHIVICLLIMSFLLETRLQQSLFFILYAINPLVLHIVTFPFYYCWTVLPSFAFAIVWLKSNQLRIWIPLLTIIVLFSLLIRPTTILISFFIFVVAFLRDTTIRGRKIIICSFIGFLLGLVIINHHSGQRSLFHTAFIGIGAYSNQYEINNLADEEGYKFYSQKTGVSISTNAVNGNWKEKTVMDHYNFTLKQRYLQILHESPLLLIKNAALNMVQAFGVGYDEKHSWSRPITILIGFLVITLLVIARQWIWMIAILLSVVSFAPYFPPIPAYLFGAYLLIALGTSMAIEKIYQWSFIFKGAKLDTRLLQNCIRIN
jgi:hypothetical protein